jgi:hypothetical protein
MTQEEEAFVGAEIPAEAEMMAAAAMPAAVTAEAALLR